MSQNLSAFLTLVVHSIVFAFAGFLPLPHTLHGLLRKTVKLEGGTFFLRPFLLLIFLSAISAAIGTSFDLKDPAFMEYVWRGAEGPSATPGKMLWFVALHLVVVTILIATRKIKNYKGAGFDRCLLRLRCVVDCNGDFRVFVFAASILRHDGFFEREFLLEAIGTALALLGFVSVSYQSCGQLTSEQIVKNRSCSSRRIRNRYPQS
jgi:hypothetical protein